MINGVSLYRAVLFQCHAGLFDVVLKTNLTQTEHFDTGRHYLPYFRQLMGIIACKYQSHLTHI